MFALLSGIRAWIQAMALAIILQTESLPFPGTDSPLKEVGQDGLQGPLIFTL